MKPSTELLEEKMGTVEYLKACLKDPQTYAILEKTMLHRARRMALMLGGVLTATLIMVVFAFVQDVKLQAIQNHKTETEAQIKLCLQEAQKQQALAVENQLILAEANKMAEEQLHECLSNR